MRDAPDLNGKIICVISYAEKVLVKEVIGDETTISGATGRWCRVVWKNKEGWVFGGFLADQSIQLKEAKNNFILKSDNDFINFVREAERRYMQVIFGGTPPKSEGMDLKKVEIKSRKDVYDIMSMYWTPKKMDKLWEEGSFHMPDMAFGFYTEGGSWIFTGNPPEQIIVEDKSSNKVTVTVKMYIEYDSTYYAYLHYHVEKTDLGWKIVDVTSDYEFLD